MVIIDAATIIGYRYESITPREIPREAMINENSPIGARLKPLLTAVVRLCPDKIMPAIANTSLAPTATTAIIIIDTQLEAIT